MSVSRKNLDITRMESDSEFLTAINEAEQILLNLQFKPYSFRQEGLSFYVKYKRDNSIVEFYFGPPEYYVELVIQILEKRYTFGDLVHISPINDWVGKNRYVSKNRVRNPKDEIFWYLDLIKFSLPIIER